MKIKMVKFTNRKEIGGTSMNEFGDIKRTCGFYVSSAHLVAMILPYVSKQLDLGIKFSSFLEFNLKQNVELILSKLILEDKAKKNVLDINWNASNSDKYLYVEKELRKQLETTAELNILIVGNTEYIEIMNGNLNKFFLKNIKKMKGKYITVINCYEVTEFNDNIKEVLDSHDLVINTAGLHKIEEIFIGYEKKVAN